MKIPNLDKKLFILLSVAVWAYIWLRAAFVPILSDEVATFFMYVQTGRFFPPDMAWDANNHILNSALARIGYLLFGPSAIGLRLASVLFAPVYFFFVFKIGDLTKNSFVRWAFYLAMMTTHFIVEFFSYSRGYGMSLALLTGAIWFLIRSVQNPKLESVIKTLVFTILAVSANLNLFQTSLVIFGVLFLVSIVNLRKLRTAEVFFMFFFIFFLGGLSTWFFADYSLHLLDEGRLYYGSGDGFWQNTILSLSALVYGKAQVLFAVYFLLMIILSVIGFVFFLKNNKSFFQNPSPGSVFLILILGNMVAAFFLYYLFGVNFQEDRTAIYYLPLFFGLAGFVVDYLVQRKGKWVLLLLIPLYFLPAFSLGKTSLVRSSYDRMPYVPKSFFEEVSSSVKDGDFPPVVAGIHKRKQVWAWFNYLSGGKMNPVLFSDEPVLSADYLIYDFEKKEKPEGLYDEILYDENSGLSLMKRKTPVKKNVLLEKVVSNTPLVFSGEYLNLLRTNIDTLSSRGLLVEFDFEIESNTIPFEGVIVCEIRNSVGKKIKSEALDLDQMQPEWNKEANSIHHSLLLSPITDSSSSLLVYIWNKRKEEFRFVRGEVLVYSYQ
ncbi:MAG: hypothetical protein GXO89_10850 [Chlorobi bacterium]|nr:hypothetical protein [Chlorobiota bacterium]